MITLILSGKVLTQYPTVARQFPGESVPRFGVEKLVRVDVG